MSQLVLELMGTLRFAHPTTSCYSINLKYFQDEERKEIR
jgi:hypothetical protein